MSKKLVWLFPFETNLAKNLSLILFQLIDFYKRQIFICIINRYSLKSSWILCTG